MVDTGHYGNAATVINQSVQREAVWQTVQCLRM